MQNDWGVPGSESRYVQAGATCKHFFSYGSSNQTQLNNLWVDNTDLLQTYLPSFEACIREAKARSIMCSYSTINGYQMCQQPDLQRILRDEWRFDGFVTADDGAISLGAGANVTYKAAGALNAGCDMGGEFSHLGEALAMQLISEQEIDVALNRSLTVRIQLGKMDPPSLVPWSSYNLSHVDTAHSRALARRAALESTVLLKNDYNYLPLSLSPSRPYSRSSRVTAPLSRIAVIGPNADRRLTLLGQLLRLSGRVARRTHRPAHHRKLHSHHSTPSHPQQSQGRKQQQTPTAAAAGRYRGGVQPGCGHQQHGHAQL